MKLPSISCFGTDNWTFYAECWFTLLDLTGWLDFSPPNFVTILFNIKVPTEINFYVAAIVYLKLAENFVVSRRPGWIAFVRASFAKRFVQLRVRQHFELQSSSELPNDHYW